MVARVEVWLLGVQSPVSSRRRSSTVEHFRGKEEVMGSSPIVGSRARYQGGSLVRRVRRPTGTGHLGW
jgi:hypothetical protein